MKQRDLDFATTEQILVYLMQHPETPIRFYSPEVDPNDDERWDYWQISWKTLQTWLQGEYRNVHGFYVEYHRGYAAWSGYPSRYDEEGEYYGDDEDYGVDPDWYDYGTAEMQPEEVLSKMNELLEAGYKPAFWSYWPIPS